MEYYIYYLLAKVSISPSETGVEQVPANSSTLGNILGVVYTWAGIIAVLAVVYGGYKYMRSQGDPGVAKQAKEIILGAVIGIVVVLSAFAITTFVIEGVG